MAKGKNYKKKGREKAGGGLERLTGMVSACREYFFEQGSSPLCQTAQPSPAKRQPTEQPQPFELEACDSPQEPKTIIVQAVVYESFFGYDLFLCFYSF